MDAENQRYVDLAIGSALGFWRFRIQERNERSMSGDDKDIKVRCPKCNAVVHVGDKAKKAMIATCPNGHEVPLVKMIE